MSEALAMSGRRRRVSAVERSLQGLSAALRASVFSEQIAARRGLLQLLDPRVKTAAVAGLIVVTGLARSIPVLAALYLMTLVMARSSAISLGYFLKRVWLFIPLFTGVIVLPSLFNVVRAGDPLFTIWEFGREVHFGPWSLGESLAVTRQGVLGAATLMLRVATSVSLAVLLTVTTRWPELLRALRVFFTPRIFILILSMTYRYIFLLLGQAGDMFTARRSRMAGASSPRDDRRFIGHSMGTLWGKSEALSEEVYAAMISRGYDGEPRSTRRFHAAPRDAVFLAFAILLGVIAIGGERLFG
jgi:cobalt/nickel transport system permease protein